MKLTLYITLLKTQAHSVLEQHEGLYWTSSFGWTTAKLKLSSSFKACWFFSYFWAFVIMNQQKNAWPRAGHLGKKYVCPFIGDPLSLCLSHSLIFLLNLLPFKRKSLSWGYFRPQTIPWCKQSQISINIISGHIAKPYPLSECIFVYLNVWLSAHFCWLLYANFGSMLDWHLIYTGLFFQPKRWFENAGYRLWVDLTQFGLIVSNSLLGNTDASGSMCVDTASPIDSNRKFPFWPSAGLTKWLKLGCLYPSIFLRVWSLSWSKTIN